MSLCQLLPVWVLQTTWSEITYILLVAEIEDSFLLWEWDPFLEGFSCWEFTQVQKLLALSASCTSYFGTAHRGSNTFILVAARNSCSLNFIWHFAVTWLVFSVHGQNCIVFLAGHQQEMSFLCFLFFSSVGKTDRWGFSAKDLRCSRSWSCRGMFLNSFSNYLNTLFFCLNN